MNKAKQVAYLWAALSLGSLIVAFFTTKDYPHWFGMALGDLETLTIARLFWD